MRQIVARSTARTCLLTLFMVGYTAMGALVFMYLEQSIELHLSNQLRISIGEFLRNNTCLEADDLESFMLEVISANDRGITVIGNRTSQPNWSFGQSFFFAGTILTTIGYGHVAPLSEGGKVFCIIYALVGIPLTLIMFTALVERLMILIHKLLKCLVERLGHRVKAFYIRLMHLSIVVTILLLGIFFIPATAFMFIEGDWNYLDSLYYCFISMTTIGLGDYIPGEQPTQHHRIVYKVATTFYLFIGLTFMMTMLATIYDVQELNIGFHFYLKSDEEDNERVGLRANGQTIPRYTSGDMEDSGAEKTRQSDIGTDSNASLQTPDGQ